MMRPGFYASARLLAVLLTVLVIAVHQHLPPRVLQLYPAPHRISWIYGPEHQGGPSTDWIDQEAGHFWCNYTPQDPYSCGWSLNLGPGRTTGLDLSQFKAFDIVMHHTGDSSRVRFLLRNFDPAYSDVDQFDVSSKVMSTALRTSDLKTPIYVQLNELSVAEWWITGFDVAREHHAPSLDNVIVLGFEFIVPGNNEVQIERINAIGEWIEKETLYFVIIFLWMTLIIIEVLSRFYAIHKKSQTDARQLGVLSNEYKKLELEKQEFEELSTTDALTGILNRAGARQFLDRLNVGKIDGGPVGVLLFDIDFFKKINDEHGHDAGDQVLVGVVAKISENIRQTDAFCRWGGEEFLLLCPNFAEPRLGQFAEKLRQVIESNVVQTQSQPLTVTVSIGATTFNPQEAFEHALKRADKALYRAKNSGRNRVCVDP